eukprot:TRINITY_DN24695_c0_g3_i1.p2 TRINITY_DN24695_c0_g3~~TRINITY_DN24695_c0_g3_i1.p2  ORF type:complete len:294 (+),score=91.99 TRINITY_DN24695_c0_g3_i1:261-1142(+)
MTVGTMCAGLVLVGQGSSGKVMRCQLFNQLVGFECVVKRPASNSLRSANALRHEVNILARLSHDNVIRTASAAALTQKDRSSNPLSTDETLVMEDMRLDLHQLLTRCNLSHSALEEGMKQNIVGQVLQGLAFIHSRGIAHRDVKPENILIKGKRVVISDFGSATLFNDMSVITDLAGSAPYMAPEVLAMQSGNGFAPKLVGGLAAAPDMFSLGLVLYVMSSFSVPQSCPTAAAAPRWLERLVVRLEDARELSLSGIQFFRAITEPRPCDRLTAAEALQTPWITSREASLACSS